MARKNEKPRRTEIRQYKRKELVVWSDGQVCVNLGGWVACFPSVTAAERAVDKHLNALEAEIKKRVKKMGYDL